MRLLFIAAVLFASVAIAGESLTPAAIVSVYDGDTFTVTLSGCPPVLCERIPVRINGVDAPEMKGRCSGETTKARLAKQFLVERLRSGQPVELRNPARDKYFRIRADVFIGGVNVGAELIDRQLARRYAGGTRGGWCGGYSLPGGVGAVSSLF